MYNLPESTENPKRPAVPLRRLADQLNLSATEKQYLDSDVASISLSHIISTDKIPALGEGKNVHAINVFVVEVKRIDYNRDLVCKLASNAKNAIFVCTINNLAQVLVNHEGHVIRSAWEPDLNFVLQGSTLDTVWDNLVMAIGQIDKEPGLSLKQQIELNLFKEKIDRQISSIEKKARAETQPRKKFEYAQQKKMLEEELDNKIAEMKASFQQGPMAYYIK